RGHFSSRRHAGRGVLPDVVLVVPATAVFEFVGSGADGEALILDLRHVHFPWCSSRPTESDYRQDVEQFVLGGCSWRGHRYSVTCHAGRWRKRLAMKNPNAGAPTDLRHPCCHATHEGGLGRCDKLPTQLVDCADAEPNQCGVGGTWFRKELVAIGSHCRAARVPPIVQGDAAGVPGTSV